MALVLAIPHGLAENRDGNCDALSSPMARRTTLAANSIAGRHRAWVAVTPR